MLPRTGPLPRPKSILEAAQVLKDESFPALGDVQEVTFETDEFTALCPISGQPDFMHIKVIYVPDKKCIESKSFKFYLWSFRDHGAFVETLSDIIAQDVFNAVDPYHVAVEIIQKPRGGISLKTIATRHRKTTERPHDPFLDFLKHLESHEEIGTPIEATPHP